MITIINGSMYQTQFKRINQNDIIIGNHTWLSTSFAYLLLAIGLYWFVIKNNNTFTKTLLEGMLFGLVVYGIYNGTNMATINQWGTKEFIVDTVWGTTLCGLLSVLSLFFIKAITHVSV